MSAPNFCFKMTDRPNGGVILCRQKSLHAGPCDTEEDVRGACKTNGCTLRDGHGGGHKLTEEAMAALRAT